MGASADFDFTAFDAQGFVQRDGLEVFDGHLSGEGDDVMEFVYFAHGVVEDAGDDASVAVAGRSSVAGAEAETADEGLALFVENELQPHAFAVVLAADEAVVLLQLHESGVVALGLRWHVSDFNGCVRCSLPTAEGRKSTTLKLFDCAKSTRPM